MLENFLFGCATTRLSGDDSFLEKGIIDSTGILELVAFVEGRYQIKVEDRELVPDNLDSINRLVDFIRRKQRLPLPVLTMTTLSSTFTADVLAIDAPRVAAGIEAGIRELVFGRLRRKGVVIGLSGGIDSSVAAALCARALGHDRVLGLFMPEADSSGDSLRLGQILADSLGIRTVLEDVGPILHAAGCYRRRDEAIRSVVPEYGDGYKSKIVLPNPHDQGGYAFYSIVVQAPDGREIRVRLTAAACLGVVAATNFKQRARKMIEYYHADRWQYAVVGTPNRLEYDQGFFVKNGDGAADLKPIAHLYKTQVYALARHFDIPEEIQNRLPTTDTYSLEQSQEEFYFLDPLARDGSLPVCEGPSRRAGGGGRRARVDRRARGAGLSADRREASGGALPACRAAAGGARRHGRLSMSEPTFIRRVATARCACSSIPRQSPSSLPVRGFLKAELASAAAIVPAPSATSV